MELDDLFEAKFVFNVGQILQKVHKFGHDVSIDWVWMVLGLENDCLEKELDYLSVFEHRDRILRPTFDQTRKLFYNLFEKFTPINILICFHHDLQIFEGHLQESFLAKTVWDGAVFISFDHQRQNLAHTSQYRVNHMNIIFRALHHRLQSLTIIFEHLFNKVIQ